MTLQQRLTLTRLAPSVPVIPVGIWAVWTGQHWLAVTLFSLLVAWWLFVEILAVRQGGQSTESELTWNLWARQPWVLWLFSVLIARGEAWGAHEVFSGRAYLLWTTILLPVWFLCGHFFAQSAAVYDSLRKGKE